MVLSKVAVIGGGSWGTALATVLAGKGHQVDIGPEAKNREIP